MTEDMATTDLVTELVAVTKLLPDAGQVPRFSELLAESKRRQLNLGRGQGGWTRWAIDTLSGAMPALDPEHRATVVDLLSRNGLSTRSISRILSISAMTASRDRMVRSAVTIESPSGQLHRIEAVRTNRGMRYPYPDSFGRAILELGRMTTRFSRLLADDRRGQYTEQLARAYYSDLVAARDLMEALVAAFPKPASAVPRPRTRSGDDAGEAGQTVPAMPIEEVSSSPSENGVTTNAQ